MGINFGKLAGKLGKAAKKAAKKGRKVAKKGVKLAPLASNLLPGGGMVNLAAREIAGSVLEPRKDKRVKQLQSVLAATTSLGRVKVFVDVVEDAWRLGEIVKDSKDDGLITDEERDAILEAAEELAESAAKAMHKIVK